MTPEQQEIFQYLTPEQQARFLEVQKRKRIAASGEPNDARARIEACDRRGLLYARIKQARKG